MTIFSTHLASRAASIATAQGLGEAATAEFIDRFLAGASDERDRIAAVMALPEAKDRPKAALSVALADDQLAPEAAARLLGNLPVEGAPVPAKAQASTIPTLEQRAAGLAEIGPGAPHGDRQSTGQTAASRAVAELNARRE